MSTGNNENKQRQRQNNIEKVMSEQQEYFDAMETERAPSGEWVEYNTRYLQEESRLEGMEYISAVVGTCEECIYSLSTGKGGGKGTHKDCKIGNGVHLNNWYCADFERYNNE